MFHVKLCGVAWGVHKGLVWRVVLNVLRGTQEGVVLNVSRGTFMRRLGAIAAFVARMKQKAVLDGFLCL